LKNSLLLGAIIVKIAYPKKDPIIALRERGKNYKMYLKGTVLIVLRKPEVT
jgi:hypothetical protein